MANAGTSCFVVVSLMWRTVSSHFRGEFSMPFQTTRDWRARDSFMNLFHEIRDTARKYVALHVGRFTGATPRGHAG